MSLAVDPEAAPANGRAPIGQKSTGRQDLQQKKHRHPSRSLCNRAWAPEAAVKGECRVFLAAAKPLDRTQVSRKRTTVGS